MSMETGTEHRADAVGHEVRDVDFRPVVAASIGLAVVIVLVLVGMWVLFGDLAARRARLSTPANPLVAESGRELPPEPRLQAAPIDDLRHLRASEEKVLTSYAWVDADKGIVRIPIERAMDLLAARGIHPMNEAGQ